MTASGGGARSLGERAVRGALRRVRRAIAWLPRSDGGLPLQLVTKKRRELAQRRTFGPDDLDRLWGLLSDATQVSSLRGASWEPGTIALRHDMDHDVDNSLVFAEWEASRGIRSTYFVQHGDWSWGGPEATRPAAYVLRRLDRIAGLGHEIGLHNNALSLALRTGLDPHAILERDLSALRAHGFAIMGTVRHGDPLCRRYDYLNSELFLDCPREDGRPVDREIVVDDPVIGPRRSVHVRARPMAEFGLDYEANWLPHDLYVSDTGGHWNQPFGGIRERFAGGRASLQILAHPVWWALSGETVRPRPATATGHDAE